MKIISVNVGQPREITVDGQTILTGIFKEPIAGRVGVRRHNLDGDRQADLTVHGGVHKAVYAYGAEHYEFWKRELAEMELAFGGFGENLTTEGLVEADTNIGDIFKIGSALLQVTQPRMPCYKLAAKFGRNDIIKRFMQSERSGIYFSVIEEGELGAGDAIELLERDKNEVRVRDITRLYATQKYNVELLRRAVQVEALPVEWRDYFQEQLHKL
ncbi:MAG: MOSC domain-containing protein [Acidobacteriota bacterium]